MSPLQPSPSTGAVKRLAGSDRRLFSDHLLHLALDDRQLRFEQGMSDEAIRRYVDAIDFTVDAVFIIGEQDEKIDNSPFAAAHLSRGLGYAELGLSVLDGHRGEGLGSALFERALQTCTHWGISELFTHCFANNRPMVHLAQKYGMRVITQGSEADGFMPVPLADTGALLYVPAT
jgi:GNAT superfamily N-acetyltransferase